MSKLLDHLFKFYPHHFLKYFKYYSPPTCQLLKSPWRDFDFYRKCMFILKCLLRVISTKDLLFSLPRIGHLIGLPLGQLLELLPVLVQRILRLREDLLVLPLGQLLVPVRVLEQLRRLIRLIRLLRVKQPRDPPPLRRLEQVQLLQLVGPMHLPTSA